MTVGTAGNRTRYQSGVYDSTCESGHYVKMSGTAIISLLLPSQIRILSETVFVVSGI